MELYVDPKTINCRKVLAGLQLLGIDYTLVNIDYLAGEHTQEPYLSINPNAALPAIVDGDLTLWESNAILQYAADKHGCENQYPTDPVLRADINRWLLWECSTWFPCCYTYLVENCVKPMMGESTDTDKLEETLPQFQKLAGILDARLATTAWLCSPTATIADIAIAAPMHLHRWSKLPLESYPNLTRWMIENVEVLPAWANTHIEDGFGIVDVN